MSESLYCPNQTILSKQGKENWDKIEWIIYAGEDIDEGDFVYIGKDNKYYKSLIDDLNWSFSRE